MKYEFIHMSRSEFVVEKMCQVLNVCRSGFYRYMAGTKSKRWIENMRLLLKAILEERVKDKEKWPVPFPMGIGE